jgi:sphinganine-1-phosphate aldolase
MEKEFGWKIESQQKPYSIHCTILPSHYKVKEIFIEDLKKTIEIYKKDKIKYDKSGFAKVYGMMGTIELPSIIDEFLYNFIDKIYSIKEN